jgi:hypothetical protein
MRLGQLRKTVQIPSGTTGLSHPIDIGGYRISAIEVPGDWAAATMTFRGKGTRYNSPDQVLPNGAVASLGPDTNAEDIQMGAAVQLVHRTQIVRPALVDPVVIDTLLVPGGTIDVDDEGILWVFQQITGGEEAGIVAVQVDKNAADYATPIEAWAQYSVATRVMPPREFLVPIGAVHVIEGGSGAFTWGTDSIAAETEAYHNFSGVPEVLVRAAALLLDVGAATFTYGAVKVRLGTGLLVTMTGKAAVTIAGTNVPIGEFGAWLIYGLADDVELAVQLGFDYPTLADANAAIAHHRKNPMLAHIGSLTVENQAGGVFIPGTTLLDAASVTARFTTEGPIHKDVYDDAGTELAVTVAADQFVELAADLKENLSGLQSVQLRSGTQATPVNQTTSPSVDLILDRV